VTVIQRASSKSKLPTTRAKVISVPDTYPVADLVSAFQGQDVVLNAITSLSVSEQHRIIDAAVTAGVKRYVPSEFGLNNLNPAAQALSPVFKEKGEVLTYLKSKQDTGLSWTSFACGMWLKWSLEHNFLGLNYAERKFKVWDDGEGFFSTTTIEDTAAAVVAALKKPDETANQLLFISNFATTQNELFAAIEEQMGEKFEREYVKSAEIIEDAHKRLAEGDRLAAYATIETGFVTGRYSGHLEKEGPLANELLGVPKRQLKDVLKEALAAQSK
jgi:putative NADH-flavin reductase